MVGLHFENLAGDGGVGAEPLFEVMPVRAVGAERVNILAIHIRRALDGCVIERRNNDHLFFKRRHTFQCWMQHRPIDKRSGQTPGKYTVDHRPGRPGGQVQIDFRMQLVVRREQFGDAHRRRAFQ